jgi:uncharacterized protein (DUF1800 family)
MITERALLARYFHRLGFGPRPGEFQNALRIGASAYLEHSLNLPVTEPNNFPIFEKLGSRPSNNIKRVEWNLKMREQRTNLVYWWLDQMASSTNQFQEKVVWFWHGHWATSLAKVDFANAMLMQQKKFRIYGLANFNTIAEQMIFDGALQFWLDNNSNTVKAPNENLARELMELFTLGVNRYTEDDIKAASKALTGYSLDRESGAVTFNVNRHDSSIKTILGRSENFDGTSLVRHLVSQENCGQFIAERLWFRFINDASNPPDNLISNAFSGRECKAAFAATAKHPGFSDEKNSMVKPPLEWFIASCRALSILPSKLAANFARKEALLVQLDNLAQKPFYPPNVGGWPAGEIWLTASGAQYRLELAQQLVKYGEISVISKTNVNQRIGALADLLGVGEWSARTKNALEDAKNDPARLIVIALCTPENLVSV